MYIYISLWLFYISVGDKISYINCSNDVDRHLLMTGTSIAHVCVTYVHTNICVCMLGTELEMRD